MYMVRAYNGDRVAYWDGKRWTAELSAAARYRDPDAAHAALIDAERRGGASDDVQDNDLVDVVQVR